MDSILKYKDSEDKSYGLTGMAIAAAVWDALDSIAYISMDPDEESSIEFVRDYVMPSNPAFSPRSVWEKSVERFRLSAGLLMANVVCRHYVHRRDAVSPEERRVIHSMVLVEGREACALDDDEIEAVYRKTSDYVDRLFSHGGVAGLARSFAESLRSSRRMTTLDIAEALAPLNRL